MGANAYFRVLPPFSATTISANYYMVTITTTETLEIGQGWDNGCAPPIVSTRYVSLELLTNSYSNFIFYYPQAKSPSLPPTFSVVAGRPLHHLRKRAHMLVFDGGCLFSNTTTTPLSKTSIRARLRGWLFVFQHHYPTTLENEHICSFSTVGVCFLTPLPHHCRKRAYVLVFMGGCLFFNTTTPPPSKTSPYARFRWWLVVFQHHYPTTVENERICSFSMVVVCISTPLPHHCRKRAYALVFDGGCIFFCI
jgi:hypothetical protein